MYIVVMIFFICRTKYADQTDKAPVIDCSRAGYFKVTELIIVLPKIGELPWYFATVHFRFGTEK